MPYNNARIPIVILLDASGSTKLIERLLNEQLQILITGLKNHPCANRIALMTARYDDQYYPITPFSPLSVISSNVLDLLDPRGATNTGTAISKALDSLRTQLSVWDNKGIPYTCPIFLLVTDGPVSPGLNPDWSQEQKTDITKRYKEQYKEAAHRVRVMVSGNTLIFGAVGIAHSSMHRADMAELSSLTDDHDCLFNPRVRFNSELDLSAAIQWMMNAVTRAAVEYAPQHNSYDPHHSASRSHSSQSDPYRNTNRSRSSQSDPYRNTNRSRSSQSDPGVHKQPDQTSGVEVDDIICVFFDLNRSNI